MVSSMSRKGNWWDNALIESLWSRLRAARVHGLKFATRQHAISKVMDWLHFYNQKRSTQRWITSAPCNLKQFGMRISQH
jgi:putative transposase